MTKNWLRPFENEG